jgi:hypothetical protein
MEPEGSLSCSKEPTTGSRYLHGLNMLLVKIMFTFQYDGAPNKHVLTPWCTIFFEKLILTQLVKEASNNKR